MPKRQRDVLNLLKTLGLDEIGRISTTLRWKVFFETFPETGEHDEVKKTISLFVFFCRFFFSEL